MPSRPLRPCTRSAAGCPNLTDKGLCEECEPKYGRAAQDRARDPAIRRLYDRKWQAASRAFLRQHPFCECDECQNSDSPEPSEVTDHRIPHKGDPALFWDRSNWQAMSKRHHDAKTAREDGGMGNRQRRNG